MKRILILAAFLACGGASLYAQDPSPLHIGIVDSLVKDLSPGKKKFIDSEFADMVKEFTGCKSIIFQGGDPLTAQKKLADKEWHLVIFQGIEFGWAQAKDPKLQPLMVAIYKQPEIHAALVAKKDGNITGFADLKGKDILFLKNKVHCELFTGQGAKGKPQEFFSKLLPGSNVETVLDDVLLGKVQAAVVDNTALEIYKEIHPGRHDRLKVLAKSEPFPSGVIAYRQGTFSDSFLKSFRAGMLKANQSDKGQEVMATFLITRFESVPADYARIMANILKVYP